MQKWLQIDHSKYYPSLATTFSHLSGNRWIPRQKNDTSFEASHKSTYFLYLHKNESAAQTDYESSIEIGGNRKEQYLKNMTGLIGHLKHF